MIHQLTRQVSPPQLVTVPQTTNSNLDQLAINGGRPVVTQPPPAWPATTDAIRTAINTAFTDNSWGCYHGPWQPALAAQITTVFATEHVHFCSSGTIAVELALRGVGVKAGDEVILAGYDFPGNFRAIEAIAALPVLVDVVAGGWVIDPAQVVQAATAKTTAVIVSHLHGQIADIPALREQLLSAGLKRVAIVEDVCQTPGGKLADQPLGSLGDAATLSFGGSKLLSAGRGGAVLTSDKAIAQRVKIANERGNEAYPLSELQAIVLGPQLETLFDLNRQRNRNVEALNEQLTSLKTLKPMSQTISHATYEPAFFKLPFLFQDTPQWSRDRWLATAEAEGVPVGAGFRGFANRSARRCRKLNDLPNSLAASNSTVLIHHPILIENRHAMNEIAAAFTKIELAMSKPIIE